MNEQWTPGPCCCTIPSNPPPLTRKPARPGSALRSLRCLARLGRRLPANTRGSASLTTRVQTTAAFAQFGLSGHLTVLVMSVAMRLVPAVLGRAISREAGRHQHCTMSTDPLVVLRPKQVAWKAVAPTLSSGPPPARERLAHAQAIAFREGPTGQLPHGTHGREDNVKVESTQRNNGARIR